MRRRFAMVALSAMTVVVGMSACTKVEEIWSPRSIAPRRTAAATPMAAPISAATMMEPITMERVGGKVSATTSVTRS